MYKNWIVFSVISVIFFIICLIIVIFNNNPVFRNYWEEGLLLVSIINPGISFSYYRHNKDEFAARWRRNKNQ